MKRLFSTAFLALIISLAGCAGADRMSDADRDIATIAASSDGFQTLRIALDAAGLSETLRGEGPFTVFAPTNAAFDKLPNNVLADLLKPENKDDLVALLTYHVVRGRFTSADLEAAQDELERLETVQGAPLAFEPGEMAFYVGTGGAAVVQPDVMATNVVVHVIDEVLLPPAMSGYDQN